MKANCFLCLMPFLTGSGHVEKIEVYEFFFDNGNNTEGN